VTQVTRLPWPVAVLAIFVLSRVASTAVLLAAALQQPQSPWGAAHPDYLDFVTGWDAQAFGRIVEHGYPAAVPRGADGSARGSAWSFFPLFPLLVKGAASLSGSSWEVAAAVVAVVCGAAASLAMYVLFRSAGGHSAALWATAIVLFSPLGALFQLPYAESLHTALLALSLWSLMTRRFAVAIPLIVLAALARPTGAPLALTMILLAAYWGSPRRRGDLSSSEFLGLLGALVASFVAALAWPLIAWIRTGEPSASTGAEALWTGAGFTPFGAWIDRSHFLFGSLWWAACLIFAALMILLFFRSPLRELGPVLCAWCASYVLCLLLMFDPQTSVFRLLLPLFPLALLPAVGMRADRLALAGPGRKRAAASEGSDLLVLRLVLVVAGLVLQVVWVFWLWRWTPLPGGGDLAP
jgi:hypothetical protein